MLTTFRFTIKNPTLSLVFYVIRTDHPDTFCHGLLIFCNIRLILYFRSDKSDFIFFNILSLIYLKSTRDWQMKQWVRTAFFHHWTACNIRECWWLNKDMINSCSDLSIFGIIFFKLTLCDICAFIEKRSNIFKEFQRRRPQLFIDEKLHDPPQQPMCILKSPIIPTFLDFATEIQYLQHLNAYFVTIHWCRTWREIHPNNKYRLITWIIIYPHNDNPVSSRTITFCDIDVFLPEKGKENRQIFDTKKNRFTTVLD